MSMSLLVYIWKTKKKTECFVSTHFYSVRVLSFVSLKSPCCLYRAPFVRLYVLKSCKHISVSFFFYSICFSIFFFHSQNKSLLNESSKIGHFYKCQVFIYFIMNGFFILFSLFDLINGFRFVELYRLLSLYINFTNQCTSCHTIQFTIYTINLFDIYFKCDFSDATFFYFQK